MIDVIVCETIEEVNDQIRQLEISTHSKYVVHGVDKGYSIPSAQWKPAGSRMRVFWEWCKGKDTPLIPFDGIPFVFVGRKMMGCHRGKDKHARKKQQYADKRDRAEQEGLDHGKKGRRNLLIKTKKLSCPALIGVTRIVKFPGFKLDDAWKMRERRAKSYSLRHALQTDPDSVQWKDLYFIRVPNLSDHVGHPIGEMADDVDERVKDLIIEKVKEGVTKVGEIKKLMVQFVENELFPDSTPPQLRAFFPKEKTVRSIMNRARKEIHFTKIDLTNLLALAESWKLQAPKTNFLLRVQSENENLLLCYQTDWQQEFLQLYGSEVCFLDGAYRRTRFPLPLYFLCVRTNVNLAVVGLFVVQNKNDEALMEALGVFKQWNPSWTPRYMLTEDCPKEMVAVETVFTDCEAMFNDYLRERTWTQWLCNGNRSIANHVKILEMMCGIAGALNTEQHQGALQQLQESSIWERPLFRDWFTSKWLAEEKRWASAVRDDTVNFVSLMNQGMVLQREFFSHKPLKEHKEKNLSEMLQFLVDDYLPQMFLSYTDLTRESSDAFALNDTLPFLWHRPKAVVTFVMENMDKAISTPAKVEEVDDGVFRVVQVSISRIDGRSYTVNFGTRPGAMPSCECEAWRSHRLPCEHFCHIFSYVSEWGWESLCPGYREHPLLTLHTATATETEDAITEITVPMSPVSCSEWAEPQDAVQLLSAPPGEAPAVSLGTPPPHSPARPTPSIPQYLSTPQVPSTPQTLSAPRGPSVAEALATPLACQQVPPTQSTLYVASTPQGPQAVSTTLIPIKLTSSQSPEGTKTILVPIVSKAPLTPQTPSASPADQLVHQIQTLPQAQSLPIIITNNSSGGNPQFVLVAQAPPNMQIGSKVKQLTSATHAVLSAAEVLCQKDELQRQCVATLMAVVDDVNKMKDISHLKDLKKKLDALQKQSQGMVPKNPCPLPATPARTPARKKRAGVEIIVTMPKRIKVENVKK